MRLKKDKSGDTVHRPSWRSSLLGDPGAKFLVEKPQHMKNSLNFANTCLKVVDTRRVASLPWACPKFVPNKTRLCPESEYWYRVWLTKP